MNNISRDFRNETNLTVSSKCIQNMTRDLINSIKAFWVLIKNDKTHKLPHRFKSYKVFQTLVYDWNSGGGGFKIIDNNIILNISR